jgi:hypothetical protein
MQLMVVTTCTDRKRFPAPLDLNADRLGQGHQDSVAAEWVARVSTAQPAASARDVYCGRSFQEALTAARSTRVSLRIISAGLGLIDEEEPVPPYNLTLVRGKANSIESRISVGRFDAGRWWGQIQRRRSAQPLARLV